MPRNYEKYTGSLATVLPEMRQDGEIAGVVSLVDPATKRKGRQIVLVTGLCAPEKSLNLLAKRLEREGHETHDLEHIIPANVVIGMEKSIERKLDQVAQDTGEAPDAVTFSLGGPLTARVLQRKPELGRRLVTVGSPISPIFGIDIPKGIHAESAFTFTDTVVPWMLSVNPSFDKHHGIFASSHPGIIFRRDIAGIVNNALGEEDPSTRPAIDLSLNKISIHRKLPDVHAVLDRVGEVAGKFPKSLAVFDRARHKASSAPANVAA